MSGPYPTDGSYMAQVLMQQHQANSGGKRLSQAEAAAMDAMRGAQAAAAAVNDELKGGPSRVVPPPPHSNWLEARAGKVCKRGGNEGFKPVVWWLGFTLFESQALGVGQAEWKG